MTIGRVTISAADWLASRVSDRMALVTAGQKNNLVQQGGGVSVQPAEEDVGAQLDRRQRERSNLAAQESYKRVAARIKSRLANPPNPREAIDPTTLRAAQDRDVAFEALRESPRIAATLIAAEQRAEAQQSNTQATRPEPLFALVDTGQKKTQPTGEENARAANETIAADSALERQVHERARIATLRDHDEPGLWDDLFVESTDLDALR